MRYVWMLMLAAALALSGCAKKDGAAQAPGHAANDNSGTAGNTNAGTGGTGSGAAAGPANTGGTAGGGAASGNTGGKAGGGTSTAPAPAKPQNLATISKAQYDQIKPDTTYDQLVKLVGSPGKLISENGDKKTYQFQLKDDPSKYVNIVFNKGKFSEKSIYAL